MNRLTDQQLLRDYAERHSEAAFAELVRRHVDHVYSTALRTAHDAHLAEDVTQAVFAAFASSAPQLLDRAIFSGWLHRTAHNIAAQTIRSDMRRRHREQEAATMNELLASESGSEPRWEQISPHLDAALGELSESDRDALMLRYFERKTAREMASLLLTSEDAAQKRVHRAVERLRDVLLKRGIAVGAGGLAVVLATNTVEAAPLGLAATSAAAAAWTGSATSTSAVLLKTTAMITFQKTLLAASMAAAIAVGIYEAHQASRLRSRNEILQREQAALSGQIGQLQHEHGEASNRLALLADENSRLKSNSTELLKLRSELTRLRADGGVASAETPMSKWTARVATLRQKLDQMPNRKIPELQFATDKDWANAVWEADLSTEDGVREALSKLREEAVNRFLNEMMKDAMKKYLAAHDDVAPGDLFQLKSYFNEPVTDEMLQRYKLLQTGKVDNSAPLVELAAFVDQEHDSSHGMSINGAWGSGYNLVKQQVQTAAMAYARDNLGQLPTDPSQLTSYLQTPLDAVTVQKYLDKVAANPPPPELITLTPALAAYSKANGGQEPSGPMQLLPYLSTTDQQAAFLKLQQMPPEAIALFPAANAYAAAHNGQPPKEPSDLLPYLSTPEEKAAISKLEHK